MSVYTHLSPQLAVSVAQGSELCLGLLFPPSLCKMLDHKRLNAFVTQCTSVLEPKPASLRQVPDGTDVNLNNRNWEIDWHQGWEGHEGRS